MDTITFDGAKYPVRFMDFEDLGMVCVGIESMENAMLDDECEYINEEAEAIDFQIMFYVPDEIIDDEGKVISYLDRHFG